MTGATRITNNRDGYIIHWPSNFGQNWSLRIWHVRFITLLLRYPISVALWIMNIPIYASVIQSYHVVLSRVVAAEYSPEISETTRCRRSNPEEKKRENAGFLKRHDGNKSASDARLKRARPRIDDSAAEKRHDECGAFIELSVVLNARSTR